MYPRLLKLILVLTSLTMLVTWLPLIRGVMDGPTYQWGQSFFGIDLRGSGISGHYWVILLQAAIAFLVIGLGWRGARPPFHWLLLLWNVPSLGNAIYNAVKFPEDYRFQGDSLGIDVSLAWVAPVFWLVLVALSIFWVVKDLSHGKSVDVPPWHRKNSILFIVVIALLPVQFLLLRFGEPHGTNDQIGVIVTMCQWLLLNLSFAKWWVA